MHSHTIRRGHLDVHSHLLPESCFTIPTAEGLASVTYKDGDLLLGSTPMHVDANKLTRIENLLADMNDKDIAVRVVSPPPYAFPTASSDASVEYAQLINDEICRACRSAPERLLALGVLPILNEAATREEMRRLRNNGAVGVAVPPVVGNAGLGDPELDYVLASAYELHMAVLVHPTQSLLPGYGRHYLRNLIGNPVETTIGVGSYLLGNGPERFPGLRIVFLHGAGCVPLLLGRWDHGWLARSDVSADTTVKPSELFRRSLYADTLTHSGAAADLLQQTIDSSRLLLGSDYPFDMADEDPVNSARERNFDLEALELNGRRWLGIELSA